MLENNVLWITLTVLGLCPSMNSWTCAMHGFPQHVSICHYVWSLQRMNDTSIFCGMVTSIRYTLKFDCPSHVFRFRMVRSLAGFAMNENQDIKSSFFLLSCSRVIMSWFEVFQIRVWSICLYNHFFWEYYPEKIQEERAIWVGNQGWTPQYFDWPAPTFSTFGCRERYLCPSPIP